MEVVELIGYNSSRGMMFLFWVVVLVMVDVVGLEKDGTPRIVPNSRGKRRKPGSKSLSSVLRCNDALFLSFLEGDLIWFSFFFLLFSFNSSLLPLCFEIESLAVLMRGCDKISVSGCLQWDPRVRYTPEEAMKHDWVLEALIPPSFRSPGQGGQETSSPVQSSGPSQTVEHSLTASNSVSVHSSERMCSAAYLYGFVFSFLIPPPAFLSVLFMFTCIPGWNHSI